MIIIENLFLQYADHKTLAIIRAVEDIAKKGSFMIYLHITLAKDDTQINRTVDISLTGSRLSPE